MTARGAKLSFASLLLAFVLAGKARAEPADDTAPESVDAESRRLLVEGARSLHDGRYDEAITAFEEAYQRTPAPGLLYNLAQAHRLKGDCLAARDLYRRYLATNPSPRQRERATARASELEPCAAAAETAAAVTKPIAAPAPSGQAAPVASLPLNPSAALVSTASRPVRSLSPTRRKVAWALGGASLVFASTGAYFGWQASVAADRASDIYKMNGTWDASAMSNERTGLRDQRLFAAGMALGVAAAAGALWILLHR